MSKLYDLLWLEVVSIIIFVVATIIYFLLIIRQKMKETEWKFMKVLDYYVKFRCLFPKATVLQTKDKEEKKKKKRR